MDADTVGLDSRVVRVARESFERRTAFHTRLSLFGSGYAWDAFSSA